jgi:hypothetical protein
MSTAKSVTRKLYRFPDWIITPASRQDACFEFDFGQEYEE